MRSFRGLTIFFLAVVCAACSRPAAVVPGAGQIDLGQNSVALFSLRLSNEHRPRHQPWVLGVVVEGVGELAKKYDFSVDKPLHQAKNKYNEYLLGLNLPPGKYRFINIYGTSVDFSYQGKFVLDIKRDFELQPGEAVYIGRIKAVNRSRGAFEPRAGSVPVYHAYDEAGFYDGVFDLQIYDNSRKDIPRAKSDIQGLGGVSFRTALLKAVVEEPKKKKQEEVDEFEDSEQPESVQASAAPIPAGTPVPKVVTPLVPKRAPEKVSAPAVEPQRKTAPDCSVDQILKMQEIGLSREQIKAACE